MKRIFCLLLLFVLLVIMTACSQSNNETESGNHISSNLESNSTNNTEANTEGQTDMTLNVKVGGQAFTVALYDNPSTQALIQHLPLSLDMSEMNGNEKYFFLSDNLPTDSENVGSIREGDFMLYGNNCLVLFYKSFSTSYSYTPLGRISDPDGFAEAVGSGDVTVEFYQ